MTKVMNAYINSTLYFSVFLLFCLIWLAQTDAMSCDSCGRECTNACGTKHFRTCCFNYLRKRSAPMESADSSNTNILQNPPDILTILDHKLQTWLRDTKDLESTIEQAIEFNKITAFKKRRSSSAEIFEMP